MSRDCAMRTGKIAAKKMVFIPRDTLFTYSSIEDMYFDKMIFNKIKKSCCIIVFKNEGKKILESLNFSPLGGTSRVSSLNKHRLLYSIIP